MNRQVARGPGKKNRDHQSTRLLPPAPVMVLLYFSGQNSSLAIDLGIWDTAGSRGGLFTSIGPHVDAARAFIGEVWQGI